MESKKINQLATELAPELSDLTIIGDPTTGISKKITLSQMASLFTGTVEEYANLASFPLVGTADTIYIALDTNIIYRWNTGTSAYVELSPNIVTSLVFNDANGFDGTISLVGSTATLTITTALTQGSIGFIGASGALTQDNSNFFWDNTNKRLGINTNTPTTAIDAFGSGIIGRLNGTSTNNAFLGFASAGSNKWSIGNVQSDNRFRIYSEANASELVSVLQTGEVGIGIANPLTKLHIFGGASALIANLDANTSVAKSISFRSGNSSRINLEVSGTESGSNAGADLFVRTYTDAGALLATPLTITRSTGYATFSSNVNINGETLTIGGTTNNAIINNIASIRINIDCDNNGTGESFIVGHNQTGINDNNLLFKIKDDGNVGIATASPNIGGYGSNSRVLTIQGVSGSYGILELTSNSANADGNAIGRLDFGSDGQAAGYKAISSIASFLSGSTSTKFGADLRFYTRPNNAGSGDPVERMRINPNGSITLVGTNAQIVQTTSNSIAGDNAAVFYNSNANSYGVYIGAGSGTNHALYCTDSTRTKNLFKVEGNGNVGINEGAPNARLDIVGPSNATSTYGSLVVRNPSNTGISIGSLGTSYAWIQGNIYGSGAANIAINANGGNVGIGTIFTNVRLYVRGVDTGSTQYALFCDNGVGDLFYVRNDGLMNLGVRANSPYNYTTGAGANCFLYADGMIGRSTSSIRFKTDIEDLSIDTTDILSKMRPIWYRSLGSNDRKDWSWYGFIAEELALIEPRLVHWGYDSSSYETIEIKDEEGNLSKKTKLKENAELIPDGVQYERITVFLVAELQKMRKEIDALKAK